MSKTADQIKQGIEQEYGVTISVIEGGAADPRRLLTRANIELMGSWG